MLLNISVIVLFNVLLAKESFPVLLFYFHENPYKSISTKVDSFI